jgi:hypothetical protein
MKILIMQFSPASYQFVPTKRRIMLTKQNKEGELYCTTDTKTKGLQPVQNLISQAGDAVQVSCPLAGGRD